MRGNEQACDVTTPLCPPWTATIPMRGNELHDFPRAEAPHSAAGATIPMRGNELAQGARIERELSGLRSP